ncbi:translation initiation factor IF-2 [candidate division KSB1 bacterium]|nr:translation initiation factor IF-2 [candidate division KSB1 bacterium]
MSTKRRIYQVAKEFDISNDTLIQFLKTKSNEVRNHMSPISDELYQEIREKYAKKQETVSNEFEFRRRIKEKIAEKASKQEAARRDLDLQLKTATQFMVDKLIDKRKAKESSDSHDSVEAFVEETLKSEKKLSRDESIEMQETESVSRPETSAELSSTPVPAAKQDLKSESTPLDQLPETRSTETLSATDDSREVPVLNDTRISSEKRHSTETESTARHREEHERVSTPGHSDGKKEFRETRFDGHRPKGSSEEIKAKPPQRSVSPQAPQKTSGTADQHGEGKGTPPQKGTGDLADKDRFKKRKRKKRGKKVAGSFEPISPEVATESKEFDEEEFLRDTVVRAKKEKPAKKWRESEAESLDKKLKENKERLKKRKKRKKKVQISEAEVDASIKQTLAKMEEAGRGRKKYKRIPQKEAGEVEIEDENLIKVNEFLSVAELASAMEIEPPEVIKKCMGLGMLVSINQRLEKDVIEMVADEFGFKVEFLPEYGQEILEEYEEEEEKDENLRPRPPVVTIMGHVDHGKTSLLDYIRESNIIAGEAGGITQHIGAYEVQVKGQAITFLDTPGHEAFTAMRARGAQITDIVILVVAADDAVMPQTIEAINHAQAAGVPIIVAINKIDKPTANADLIRKQLAENNVLIEEWGGKYQCVEISAKMGQGIPKLLDMILIEAEVLELKENYERTARGIIIESRLDKGKGVVATILVQSGTLTVGEPFIVGQYFGKVRSLYNERNQRVEKAGPSVPVQVVGFSGLPAAGDSFFVLKSEKDTREISLKRRQIKREQDLRRNKRLTLDEISRRIKQGAVKELNIIVKGDVDGSVEAISDSLLKLSNQEVAVKVIHKGVGAISESDVLLASASNAIILGFQVRPTLKAREVAKREVVDIRQYSIIYDAISEVKNALEGLLEPELVEDVKGTIEVRQVFRIPKVGVVAGSYVLTGRVARNDKVKLYRDDKLIYDGKVISLRRFKEDTKEVTAGFECGISFGNFDDVKVNDIVEPYRLVQVKRTLASAS